MNKGTVFTHQGCTYFKVYKGKLHFMIHDCNESNYTALRHYLNLLLELIHDSQTKPVGQRSWAMSLVLTPQSVIVEYDQPSRYCGDPRLSWQARDRFLDKCWNVTQTNPRLLSCRSRAVRY
jgi:hypothetical protein